MMNIFKVALSTSLVLCLGISVSRAADTVYTLDDAYHAALANNENVKIAEEDVYQSEIRIDEAKSYIYPRIDAAAGYTRFNETLPPEGGSFIFSPLSQVQASLMLTQPLYTGGRTLAAFRTAKKMREASSGSLDLTRQNMMLSVAQAYYGVLKAQKTVEISTRSLERMEHHKEITEREAQTRKTKANVSALLRANSLVAQARIALIRAQDGLKIAKEKLSLLTKLPADLRVAEAPYLEQPADDLAGLQKSALIYRDDYANSRITKSIAEENVTIVEGGHYPQLAAVAGVQYTKSDPTIITDATLYYGGLRLQVPIFEGGLMKAEVSEARSKVRQADLASEFIKKTIETEVQEAFVNLQTVMSVLATAKLQMDYAKGNYDAVEGLFSEGLLSSLSLIDAEQALTLAENELMNATYDQQLSILRLQNAMGTLGKKNP